MLQSKFTFMCENQHVFEYLTTEEAFEIPTCGVCWTQTTHLMSWDLRLPPIEVKDCCGPQEVCDVCLGLE